MKIDHVTITPLFPAPFLDFNDCKTVHVKSQKVSATLY